MKFVSTRGQSPAAGLSEAIRRGAAPDGGLYMPEQMPAIDHARLRPDMELAELASVMLGPFFAGDPLENGLSAIAAEAFDFPVPLVVPDAAKAGLRSLELFHGPTGAFKDFGARFLMACFDRIGDPNNPLTVLVATSGDTGGAVGCAAEGRAAVRALILFPRGRVSAFQELQLTCWNKPVRALEVEGDFDDCQRLVKAAFSDRGLSEQHNLTSANSINLGRLLPQTVYIASAALQMFAETGEKPGFILPTGNLGHGVAALFVRALGFPIGPIVLATNANRTLADWHASGRYEPRASIATIANAMDVGAPSNFERLIGLPADERELSVELVDDDHIRARIVEEYRASGYIWCPHSATTAEAYARLDDEQKRRPWVAASTAHPYKFADVIEPLIDTTIEPTAPLAAILGRKADKTSMAPELNALATELASERKLAAA